MNKTTALLFLLLLLIPGLTSADTTFVAGEQSGIWFSFGSPYVITDDVTVPNSTSLIIQSGIEVIFAGHYKLNIGSNAILKAIGTESDSIIFTAMDTVLTDTSGGHHGLRFLHSAYGCTLAYCRIMYGNAFGSSSDVYGGGIFCYYVSPTIINCLIKGNQAEEGGGIYCNVSNPLVRRCVIAFNSARIGGGIMCNESGPSIETNFIIYNSAESGGAIECFYSSPNIWINEIAYNSADRMNGGGIDCVNSSPPIFMNMIHDNTAKYGAGIRLADSYPEIDSNTIVNNTANFYGGGIYCENSNPEVKNTIIAYNTAIYYSGGVYCVGSSPVLVNDVLMGNSAILGGALFAWDFSYPSIINCTVINNTADSLGGGVYSERDSDYRIFNSILWDNEAVIGGEIYLNYFMDPCTLFVAYSDVDPEKCAINPGGGLITWGDGNIIEAPHFEDDFYLTERSAGNDDGAGYVITPWGDTLMAPLADIDSDPRPQGDAWDMGALPSPFFLIDSDPRPQGDAWDMGADESPFYDIDEDFQLLPSIMTLSVYPNPFNAEITLDYLIPFPSHVELSISNMQGQKVETILAGRQFPGNHTLKWSPARDMPSGIYFVNLRIPSDNISKKILYLR